MRSYISFPFKLHPKIHRNNVDFSSIEIKLGKKENIETTSIFRSSKLRRTKYVETTSIFRSSKLLRREYVETTSIFRSSKLHRKSTSKWRGSLSIFSFQHIDVIWTLNRRRFDVVCPVRNHLDQKLTKMTQKSEFHRFIKISHLDSRQI